MHYLNNNSLQLSSKDALTLLKKSKNREFCENMGLRENWQRDKIIFNFIRKDYYWVLGDFFMYIQINRFSFIMAVFSYTYPYIRGERGKEGNIIFCP